MALNHVTVLGFPKVLATSITIPVEMLYAADMISRINGRGQHLTLELASLDGGELEMTAGLKLSSIRKIDDITETDMVIVPALWGNPKGVVKSHPQIQNFLQEQHAMDTLLCGVGTGSFFLAEAGLLTGKVGTTHWYYFDAFAKQYPEVHLQRDRFITRAGNIYCAGSVNSVRDVMLFLIEEFYDPAIAHQVSRHFTHEIKRTYTTSYLKNSPQDTHDDESIINVQEWILSRYHTDINITELAQQFGMSVRTLNRHFREATGQSPVQYLQRVRLDNARELLKSTNLSVSEIAFNVGYSDTSYFSAQFRKNHSLTPSEYRRMVRKKLFQVES